MLCTSTSSRQVITDVDNTTFYLPNNYIAPTDFSHFTSSAANLELQSFVSVSEVFYCQNFNLTKYFYPFRKIKNLRFYYNHFQLVLFLLHFVVPLKQVIIVGTLNTNSR